MHELISFGAVWSAWHRGWHPSFRPKEVPYFRSHPADCRFHFGVRRAEVLEGIPTQVTWMNKDPESWIFDPDEVVIPEMLDEPVLKQWSSFTENVLMPAAISGRVFWNICGGHSKFKNYYDYAANLLAQGRDVGNYLPT
jgi:hypothetical protein